MCNVLLLVVSLVLRKRRNDDLVGLMIIDICKYASTSMLKHNELRGNLSDAGCFYPGHTGKNMDNATTNVIVYSQPSRKCDEKLPRMLRCPQSEYRSSAIHRNFTFQILFNYTASTGKKHCNAMKNFWIESSTACTVAYHFALILFKTFETVGHCKMR